MFYVVIVGSDGRCAGK